MIFNRNVGLTKFNLFSKFWYKKKRIIHLTSGEITLSSYSLIFCFSFYLYPVTMSYYYIWVFVSTLYSEMCMYKHISGWFFLFIYQFYWSLLRVDRTWKGLTLLIVVNIFLVLSHTQFVVYSTMTCTCIYRRKVKIYHQFSYLFLICMEQKNCFLSFLRRLMKSTWIWNIKMYIRTFLSSFPLLLLSLYYYFSLPMNVCEYFYNST